MTIRSIANLFAVLLCLNLPSAVFADQWEMKSIADARVSTPSLSITGEWTVVAADLTGTQKGWVGIQATPTAGMPDWDTLDLNAAATGRARVLFVTLTEQDGSRWNTAVGITTETTSHQIHPRHFRWFAGPEARKLTRPKPETLKSVEFWVGNTFQGENGFKIQEPVLSDGIRKIKTILPPVDVIPLQRDTTVSLKLAMGDRRTSLPTVWLSTSGTTALQYPESVTVTSETLEFPVFARTPGITTLYLYEPEHDFETSIPLTVSSDGLSIRYGIEGFAGEQVMGSNEALVPTLALEGSSSVPLSIHVEVSDHTGSPVVSEFQSVPEILAGKGRFRVPGSGLHKVHIRAFAEGIDKISYPWDMIPTQLGDAASTTALLPSTMTTASLLGMQITFESIPTTATLIGEDRYDLLVTSPLPRERILNRWPFGLCSGSLMHLSIPEIATVGMKRLAWHRKLGSTWARNDIWWNAIETNPGTYQWSNANPVVHGYRKYSAKLAVMLGYNPAWNPDKSPADAQDREHWSNFIRRMERNYDGLIWAFEVWNEPNTGLWKPEPNAADYRELVKTTWDAVRTSGTETISGPRIVAGATANFDPVFLKSLFTDNYERFFDALSFHPYPMVVGGSPESNAFSETIDEAFKFLSGSAIVGARSTDDPMHIWLTELGYGTGPFGVDYKTQANFLVRQYTISLYKKVGKIFWFNLMDWESLPWKGEDPGAQMGLLDANYRIKPSAAAYNLATFWMASMLPTEYRKQGDAHIYSFDVVQQSLKWPGKMVISWTDSPESSETLIIPHVSGGEMFAVDYLGAAREPLRISHEDDTTSPARELFHYRSTYEPVYIWDAGSAPLP